MIEQVFTYSQVFPSTICALHYSVRRFEDPACMATSQRKHPDRPTDSRPEPAATFHPTRLRPRRRMRSRAQQTCAHLPPTRAASGHLAKRAAATSRAAETTAPTLNLSRKVQHCRRGQWLGYPREVRKRCTPQLHTLGARHRPRAARTPLLKASDGS